MKKLSLILASLVLFAGVSFANPVVKAKQDKQKTEKKDKGDKKGGKDGKKGGKKGGKKDDKSAK